MKKALLALLVLAFVASASMASATNVTISGDLRPIVSYSSVSGSKPWLNFAKSDITLKSDAIDDVTVSTTLRLQEVGTTKFLHKVSVTVDNLYLPGLSLKVGQDYIPFTEFKTYLLYAPGTIALANKVPEAILTYTDPAYAISGGLFNFSTEGVKSGVIKASTGALLEGLYVAAAVKSEAAAAIRTNTLALVGQYKFSDLILDAEYAMALNGDVKPSVIMASATYQFMAELLGSIRFESYKESATDYIIDGGLAYLLRQTTQAIVEITHTKLKATGDTSMLYTLGLKVTF